MWVGRRIMTISGKLALMSDDLELDPTDENTWPVWMTLAEVGKALRVSSVIVSRLVETGQLPSTVIGESKKRVYRRVKRSDVLNLGPVTVDPSEETGEVEAP